jgi:hypothetical protein
MMHNIKFGGCSPPSNQRCQRKAIGPGHTQRARRMRSSDVAAARAKQRVSETTLRVWWRWSMRERARGACCGTATTTWMESCDGDEDPEARAGGVGVAGIPAARAQSCFTQFLLFPVDVSLTDPPARPTSFPAQLGI